MGFEGEPTALFGLERGKWWRSKKWWRCRAVQPIDLQIFILHFPCSVSHIVWIFLV